MTFQEIMTMSARIGASLIGAGIVFCGWPALFLFFAKDGNTATRAVLWISAPVATARLGLPQVIWQATTLPVDLVAPSPGACSSCLSRVMLALAPQAELHGIDCSPQSLSVAARTNTRLIEQGRVFLREADVSDLPYDDGRFDLVVAINSHCFWSDLAEGLREVMRALQPGGTVAPAGGEYFGGSHDTRNRRLASNGRMNCQTLPELRDTSCEAGYSNTEIHEEWDKGWFCVAGRKAFADTEGSSRPT